MPPPEEIERGPRTGIPGATPTIRPTVDLEAPLSESERLKYEALLGKPAPVARASDGLSALIVDEDPNLRRDLTIILKGWGFDVAETPGGATALKALAGRHFDLLACDLKLQEMDGYTLVRGARSYLRIRETFIVVQTGMSDPKDEVAALNIGADAFFRKPHSRELLFARFKPLVRRIYERAAPKA